MKILHLLFAAWAWLITPQPTPDDQLTESGFDPIAIW
jgi:hypothetical protein